VDTSGLAGFNLAAIQTTERNLHNRGTTADLNYQPANSLLGGIAYQEED